MAASADESIEKRLKAVEAELFALRERTRGEADLPPAPSVVLRAHFGRAALERKPYLVTLGVPQQIARTLTPIRTAILLVLLMDLLERSESGRANFDNLLRVKAALAHLDPAASRATSDDAVRVALYRAGQFIQEEFSGDAKAGISFSVDKGLLTLHAKGWPLLPSQVEVEITASDPAIATFLDETLATSPLSRLRKSKSLFLPGGNEGQDRLLLELLDHDYPVRACSLHHRPSPQSTPAEILLKQKASPRARARQELMMRQLQSGTLQYTEVIPRRSLWEMIDRSAGNVLDPFGSKNMSDLLMQLDHLQFLVRSARGYELVLTDAFFPFYLTAFELTRASEIERFVLFVQAREEQQPLAASTFALKDDQMFFNVHERIIRWILAHPSTIRGKEHLLNEIAAARAALLEGTEDPVMPIVQDNLERTIDEPPLAALIERSIDRKGVGEAPKRKGKTGAGNRANRPGSSR